MVEDSLRARSGEPQRLKSPRKKQAPSILSEAKNLWFFACGREILRFAQNDNLQD